MGHIAACGLEEATLLLVGVKFASEGAHGRRRLASPAAPARLEDTSPRRPLSRPHRLNLIGQSRQGGFLWNLCHIKGSRKAAFAKPVLKEGIVIVGAD